MGGIDFSEPAAIWLSLGILLAIAELVAPGVFLIWLGIGALLTGVTALLTDLPVWAQLGEFAVLSIVAVYLGRQFLGRPDRQPGDPLLNDRVARLIGSQVIVEEAIVAGSGKVRVGDGLWLATGEDVPVGAVVHVTGARDGVLIVSER